MANKVTILLLSILAAQCRVSTAQHCAIDIARADALLHPSYTQIEALKEQLDVAKQLLTCSSTEAQNCAIDIARADALLRPLYTQIDALNEQLNVTKQLLTCSRSEDLRICTEGPMGIEDGRIPDSSLTASSIYSTGYEPQRARLNNQGSATSWLALDNDQTPWIQVDFQRKVHMTGVITQGHNGANQWVREYQVAFSQDGSTWTNVADAEGPTITFTGNTDYNTEVTNRFPAAVTARYLRIYPTACHAYRSMRFEVIGCATA